MRRTLLLPLLALVLCSYSFPSVPGPKNIKTRPADGSELDVTPPGFTWWRAGGVKDLKYKVFIYNEKGEEVLSSPASVMCAWRPESVLPEGKYVWFVRAYDNSGKMACKKKFGSFTILPGAEKMPMPDIRALIASVPKVHPRLIFTKDQVPALNERIRSEHPEIMKYLRDQAAKCLDRDPLPEPEFSRMTENTKDEFARKRMAYRDQFGVYRNFYTGAVTAAALLYALTGEKAYGQAAKKHMLSLTRYEVAGEGSPVVVFRGNFDEFTMGYADCLMWSYDWAWDCFSPEEREKMEDWMVQLMDAMYLRMSPEKNDYLCSSTDSHSGRIPPMMMNYALTLTNHPEKAEKWMRQALTFAMTSYPHWGSPDGGWAEGVFYSSGYNTRMLAPYEVLKRLGGPDLLRTPYFRNYPYFLSYASSFIGENMPFGDTEDNPIRSTAPTYAGMISFLASKYNDGHLQWFADMFRAEKEEISSMPAVREYLCFPEIVAEAPSELPQSRFFKDTGIAAMHTDIAEPRKDLVVLLKSSPFGSVSHSHMDQNSFWIMKGGKSLCVSAGSRYPVASSPFHEEYTRQSLAHNTILFGGRGQVPKSAVYAGRLGECSDDGRICYACGKAETAYQGVSRFDRHMVLIRPDVLLMLDDLAQDADTTVEWLFHAKEKLRLTGEQSFVSTRLGQEMSVQLFATAPLSLSQTSEWLVAPKKGYEFTTSKDPAPQWHLTAKADRMKEGRILAVMCTDPATKVSCRQKGGTVTVKIRHADGTVTRATCSLEPSAEGGNPFTIR